MDPQFFWIPQCDPAHDHRTQPDSLSGIPFKVVLAIQTISMQSGGGGRGGVGQGAAGRGGGGVSDSRKLVVSSKAFGDFGGC